MPDSLTLIILAIIALVSVADIAQDLLLGLSSSHIVIQGLIALVALAGGAASLRNVRKLARQNAELREHVMKIRESELKWREESQRHVKGLAHAIDEQLTRWLLSPAEKEVALLLLKGLSLKEIAALRRTSDKTVRQQSLAVYQKSGLNGRAELAAFFLEDLLVTPENNR